MKKMGGTKEEWMWEEMLLEAEWRWNQDLIGKDE